jgi:hypothetical protein
LTDFLEKIGKIKKIYLQTLIGLGHGTMFVLVPKETIAVAGRADEKDGKDKDQTAN